MFSYIFFLLLLLFLLFLIIKFVFIIFISFFDKVSSFTDRILSKQKQEWVIRNCQLNCMLYLLLLPTSVCYTYYYLPISFLKCIKSISKECLIMSHLRKGNATSVLLLRILTDKSLIYSVVYKFFASSSSRFKPKSVMFLQ